MEISRLTFIYFQALILILFDAAKRRQIEFKRTLCDAMAISMYKKAAVLTITKIRYAPHYDSIYYFPLIFKKMISPRGRLDLVPVLPPPHTPPIFNIIFFNKASQTPACLQHAFRNLWQGPISLLCLIPPYPHNGPLAPRMVT